MLLPFLIPFAAAATPAVLFPVWPGEGEDHAAIALDVPATGMKELLSHRGSDRQDVNSDGGPYTRSTLTTQEIAGVAIGSRWAMLGEGTRSECVVESFHVVTTGRPEDPLPEFSGSGSPCSLPLVYARTSCTNIHPVVVVPASNTTAAVGTEVRRPETPAFGDLTGIDTIRSSITKQAGERRVRGDIDQIVYQVGKTEVTITNGHFYTGEGEWFCGGEDLSTQWSGVSGGGHRTEVRQIGHGGIIGVTDIDGDGRVEVIETVDNQTTLRDAEGHALHSLSVEWCVCGC